MMITLVWSANSQKERSPVQAQVLDQHRSAIG